MENPATRISDSCPSTYRLPRCILLNGTSSSGKTTLARALQECLPVVYLNLSIDTILYTLPPPDLAAMMEGRKISRREYRYSRLVDGFHGAISGLLATGNRLIVDNAMTRSEWRSGFEAAVAGHDTVRIAVSCERGETLRRERARGDRALGTVDRELPLVHVDMVYDLTVDTTHGRASDIAERIWDWMKTQRLGED